MINGNSVFLVGSDNSDLMKSRYHYKTDIKQNEIVINSVLASCLQYEVNESISINGIDFIVKEIIEDVTGSPSSITIAIFNENVLDKLLGEKPDYNFLLISVHDNVKISSTVEDIKSIDRMLYINAIEEDELYRDSIESFSIYILFLSFSVIIVTVLFVTSNMKGFIYKYKHDIAIIRALGGNSEQVKSIFRYIIIYINLLSCIGGFIISVILNAIILSRINSQMNMIKGKVQFYYYQSFLITALCFTILVFLLSFSIRKNLYILPLEAMMKNELSRIGKRGRVISKSIIHVMNKFLSRDAFITLKFLLTKLKENLLITGTIMMIVVISFIGGSLTRIIQNNNNEYLKNQYLTDIVVTSSNIIYYKDFVKYYEILQNTEGIDASILISSSFNGILKGKSMDKSFNYLVGDLNSMERQKIFTNHSAERNRIILSEELAKEMDILVGEKINVLTPPKYIYDSNGRIVEEIKEAYEVSLYVTAILPGDKMQSNNAIIDIGCEDFMDVSFPINRIYISGDLDTAELILKEIKGVCSGIKWANYENVIEISNKTIRERYIMFEVVVGILVILAGIGWYNAIRHTILSRKDEYNILRINGMSIRRLRKMLMSHIFIYLVIGIGSGIIIGMILLAILTYLESGESNITLDLRTLAYLLTYMIILSILLIPDVLKVSRRKVLDIE